MQRYCACCGEPFLPRPQAPNQMFCSSPDCQRERRRLWQLSKRLSDSHYRDNQRAAQKKWAQRNPDYWRDYRASRSGAGQRGRAQRQTRDQARNSHSEKMDVCDLLDGLYRITWCPGYPRRDGDSWVVEITPVV